MLQILLAVIGLTLVSALGLITVQQFALQARIQDQVENIRRLDIAAASLQGSLGKVAGINVLLAPAPRIIDDGYAILPAGIGAINQTVAGVPFLYCPVGKAITDAERNSISGVSAGNVQMNENFYPITLAQNFVIDDGLTFTDTARQPNIAGERIVAFIVAAGTRGTAPIDCNNIYVVDGKPVVSGGIVRAVSAPNDVTENNAASIDFWVAPNGNGTGRTQNSPTSIDVALNYFVNNNPSQMTLNVIGVNTVSQPVWARFSDSSTVSGATLRIIGISDTPTLNLTAATAWNIPASTVIQQMNIVGPTLIIGPGDTLTNSFNVSYTTTTGSGSSILTLPGGKFVAGGRPGSSESISFSTNLSQAGFAGIINRGTVEVSSVNLIYGGNVSVGLVAGTGSVTQMSTSSIGSPTRTASTPILVENDVSAIRSDDLSAVTASSAGFCMLPTNNTNPATRWSQLIEATAGGSQVGQRSAIVGESAYARPADDSDPAVLEAYQNDFNGRLIGRRLNSSNFICQ